MKLYLIPSANQSSKPPIRDPSPADLTPTPVNQVQICQINDPSNPGPGSEAAGPWSVKLGPWASELDPRTTDLGPWNLTLEPRTLVQARLQVRF